VFEVFASNFRLLPAGQVAGEPWRDPRLLSLADYPELAARFAGCSFENGLYRLQDARTGPQGEAWIAEAFPQFASRACPFGYDWLRQAVRSGRQAGRRRRASCAAIGAGDWAWTALSLI